MLASAGQAQVGFLRFTDYSRTSDREWFAETVALFGTDRERFWELNWRMCRWIEDGFPRLDGYVPKP
ncbi:hypothetical protein [Streptosporangium subroseum]|uniref:hypothetical protein n=1 Tax=Streptosporangium subroseum TaxID=106412 RepID=UPI003086FCC4|nr:hypothetical protein OHB15_19745 [Streptosporangium subroseum]